MNVQELIDALMKVEDKTLPVAFESEDHDYWGALYSIVQSVNPARNECIHGPKSGGYPCVLLEKY